MRVLQRGYSGDGCDLLSTLCKYDLRKGDLFVLSWARVRRVRRGSISSELLMSGGGVPLLKMVVFLILGVLKYVVCLCKGCMDVVFSVCVVTHRAVGARVEV